ncbi:hypothetical protein NEUTE1DRAFT_43780 [Neurospora tetrasperma FGSC 2508]|uniref:Uncharacterized protein n=1 Tax=Neurospora tetrasperma (strain FGSC 2508 / ATCC MYA-4615 / P0657) TaxID=510951 RepID=F8MPD4_NEUT8|nr:uncharacterized protein NEUTE1DRAFT_43780 [Neurospora tetrasperma FGSC 2508]EGO56299.1 hypothetical protein NEUTE1DRAFT_43780 [Neurospora tetrasperma FGSC 2508]EGZ70847.1 hypothetical protein NEUTE2DRAFT_69405 [Neurospora tetrasperma FGSC 2509]
MVVFGRRWCCSQEEPSEAFHPEWRYAADWVQTHRPEDGAEMALCHLHPELVHLL